MRAQEDAGAAQEALDAVKGQLSRAQKDLRHASNQIHWICMLTGSLSTPLDICLLVCVSTCMH